MSLNKIDTHFGSDTERGSLFYTCRYLLGEGSFSNVK